MFLSSLRMATAAILTLSLVSMQVVPALADAKKIPVTFVGIQFENLPDDVQKGILERVTDLLTSESSLQVNGPDQTQKLLGIDRAIKILKNPEQTDFAELAEKLNATYIYGGRISNNARDGERILLAGELFRYDHVSNLTHKFELLKYYDTYGVELLKFKEEFIKTIITEETGGLKILPLLVLGGIIVGGIAAFALVTVSGGGSGNLPEDPTPPLSVRTNR